MKGGPVGDRDRDGQVVPGASGQASMKGGPVGDRDLVSWRVVVDSEMPQ